MSTIEQRLGDLLIYIENNHKLCVAIEYDIYQWDIKVIGNCDNNDEYTHDKLYIKNLYDIENYLIKEYTPYGYYQ